MKTKNKELLFLIFVIFISLLLRYPMRDMIVGDMVRSLLPWFEYFQSCGGLHGLCHQIGNYNLLYQTILAFLTYIDCNPVYLIKISSVIFDYVLASCVSLIVKNYHSDQTNHQRTIPVHYWAFAITLFIPTVMINSAWWGQCDA